MSRPSQRLVEIARRREQLSARAAAQRAAVAGTFHQLRAPLGVADRVLEAAYFARAHPVLFGAGVAAVVALLRGPARLLPTVGRGLVAWRILRVVSGWPIERPRSREAVSR